MNRQMQWCVAYIDLSFVTVHTEDVHKFFCSMHILPSLLEHVS